MIDDGPGCESAAVIYSRLVQHDAKPTLFMIGDRAAQYPDGVTQVVDFGHTYARPLDG
jgi:peptidoglycan/xylan/chitin deacetylase (PgdA/CDA1 family)